MRVGVVSCSRLKLPVPAPAWMLYSRSPRFSQGYQYLLKKCDSVYILSAKYGLVDPNTVLAPYDTYLEGMSTSDRKAWSSLLARQRDELSLDSALFVGGSSYLKALRKAGVQCEAPEGKGIYELAKELGYQGKLRRGSPLGPKEVWPIEWILKWVYDRSPVKVVDLYREIKRRYTHPTTINCQIERAVLCPLHVKDGDYLRSRYTVEEQ